MPSLHQADRRQIAKIAANASWANTADPTARTKPGRDAFLKRFEDQVDPDRSLPPEVRSRRAESAKKAYFAALALRSSRARRRRAVPDKDVTAADPTSGMSIEQVTGASGGLSAEDPAELAALLLSDGGRT